MSPLAPSARVAPHFTRGEFKLTQDDGTKVIAPAQYDRNVEAIAPLLEWFRELANAVTPSPVVAIVTSFVRTHGRQAAIYKDIVDSRGEKPRVVNSSDHFTGRATDVVFAGANRRAMIEELIAREMQHAAPDYGQVIVYLDLPHLHISLPRSGKPNREKLVSWSVRRAGQTVRHYAPLSADWIRKIPTAPVGALVLLVAAVAAWAFLRGGSALHMWRA